MAAAALVETGGAVQDAPPMATGGPPFPPNKALTEKPCLNCSRVLPIKQFKEDTRRPDGYALWCNGCREAQRKRLEETRAKGSINGGRLARNASIHGMDSKVVQLNPAMSDHDSAVGEILRNAASIESLTEKLRGLTEAERIKLLLWLVELKLT